ncbi:Protein LAZ1 [Zea mays]|uniref:Protein LAZ1 n=1 Tax=Zea mays TaxID=4577 RepID=A0A1D6EWK2_MAIZE|nr:Protein LAZ1 [Zea mays]
MLLQLFPISLLSPRTLPSSSLSPTSSILGNSFVTTSFYIFIIIHRAIHISSHGFQPKKRNSLTGLLHLFAKQRPLFHGIHLPHQLLDGQHHLLPTRFTLLGFHGESLDHQPGLC